MAWEVNTVMTSSDPASAASDANDRGVPTLKGVGATEVTAWQILTGPFVGKYVMQSRWDSLTTFATGMREVAQNAANDAALAEMLGRWTSEMRIVLADVIEGGRTNGEYLMSTRFSSEGPQVGLAHAIDLATSNGAVGARILTATAAGEWTGQTIGTSWYDSLDDIESVLASNAGDDQMTANARAAGLRIESRSLFHRL